MVYYNPHSSGRDPPNVGIIIPTCLSNPLYILNNPVFFSLAQVTMLHKSRTFSCELTKLLECPVTFLTDHLTVDRFQISTHSHHPTFHGLHDLVDELMHHTSHLLCRAGGNGRCHRWHRQTSWCCGGIRHWQHRSQDRCRKCALQLGENRSINVACTTLHLLTFQCPHLQVLESSNF